MKIEYKVQKYDGLIIGGGGAGLKAAIEAHDKGAKMAVVMKCLMGKAHTVMAEGGMTAAVGKGDSREKHFVDTIVGGYGLNDWESVWRMVSEAKDTLFYLEEKGAIFDRSEKGDIEPRAFGGHGEKRTCHVSDRTGHAIIHTLKNEVIRRDIDFLEKVMVTSLLIAGGRVVGATAVDIRSGELILFKAKFVILATGGCGAIYKYTTNSKDLSGDGVYLAYDAGAELVDMEFIQFHPTCMLEPEEKRGILVTEACRGEGGILINARGERFMKSAKNPDGTPKYTGKLGHPELETRDVVSRAIEAEYEKGLGPVRLVVCKDAWRNAIRELKIPEELRALVDEEKLLDQQGVKERLSTTHEQFRIFVGIDITKEPMIVRSAQHYMMGGIKTDGETGMSSIRGLFAAGEVVGGVHGANRLGGNSLTDIQVEGVVAGREAANYSKSVKEINVDENIVEKEFSKLIGLLGKGGTKQSQVRKELQELMWKHVSIKRNEMGLKTALIELKNLKSKARKIKVSGDRHGNVAWQEAMETIGMLKVAEAIIVSALERKESRGSHYRTDYVNMDKKWLINTVIKKRKDGKMQTSKVKIKPLPSKLKKLFPKDWLKKVYG